MGLTCIFNSYILPFPFNFQPLLHLLKLSFITIPVWDHSFGRANQYNSRIFFDSHTTRYLLLLLLLFLLLLPLVNKPNDVFEVHVLINQDMFRMKHHPSSVVQSVEFYRRYVDDTFALFNTEQDALSFFSYINSQHPNIKFTMEREENQKLSFLDVLLDNLLKLINNSSS